MIAAIAIASDMDTGRLITAAITINSDIGIICRRTALGGWEPDYMILRGGETRPLPSCFVLNDEALVALNMLAQDHEDRVSGETE